MGKVIKELPKNNLPHMKDFDSSFMSENFFDIDKDFFLDYKPLHQRLSCNFINYNSIKTEEEFIEKAIKYITRTAFGLFGFITKEVSPNIHLNIESNQSFCGLNENKVQIGLKPLLNKNINREVAVDIIVSDIYHEFYHKRYTNTDIGRIVGIKKQSEYYKQDSVKEYVKNLLTDETKKSILNILEDRRIEKLGAQNFPGYTFFFEEQRKYAAYLHNYGNQSLTPPYEMLILQFLGIKILLPELLPSFILKLDECIPKLIEFYNSTENKVETVTEGLASTPEEKLISEEELESQKITFDKVRTVINRIDSYIEGNTEIVYSETYEDIITAVECILKLIPKELRDEINAASKTFIKISLDFLGGNDLEQTEDVSEELKTLVENIITKELKEIEKELKDSEANKKNQKKERKIEKVNSPNNIAGYETFEIITEPVKAIDYLMLSEAKKISKSIFNNLGFLDSRYQRNNEMYELTEGEIDEDELYSISFHNKSLFEDVEDIPSYSLDFGILLDESGSMSGRIKEAKLAVLSMILALKDNKNINLFVNGHTANDNNYSDKTIQIFEYYNTIKRQTNWQTIFSAEARSNNADGYAIEKMGKIMRESPSKDKILCVVSDGQPSASSYGGAKAEEHVRQVVNELERDGIMVIQICMAYIENSGKMFNNFIPFEKDGVFFEKLKKILLTKLSQFSDSI